jgi:hypothetical protein
MLTQHSSAFSELVDAYDVENSEEVLLRPFALFFPGDNPMQAELASCGGLASNFFCRTCTAGGTQEFKRSREGFASLFTVSAFFLD